MQDDLIELQTQLAFQEEANNQLSDVVADQQRQIDRLRQEMRLLNEKYQELLDSLEKQPAGNERPPHY